MELTTKEKEVFNEMEKQYGRCWKAQVRAWWNNGLYPRDIDSATLQHFRNTKGNNGLRKVIV